MMKMLTAAQARDIYGHLRVIEKTAGIREGNIRHLVSRIQEELDEIKALLIGDPVVQHDEAKRTPLGDALARAERLLQWSPKSKHDRPGRAGCEAYIRTLQDEADLLREALKSLAQS